MDNKIGSTALLTLESLIQDSQNNIDIIKKCGGDPWMEQQFMKVVTLATDVYSELETILIKK